MSPKVGRTYPHICSTHCYKVTYLHMSDENQNCSLYDLFQAKPGDPISITEGSIQANITDTLETKTILYQLDPTQSDFTLLDNTKCEVVLAPTFDLSHLGQDGIYDLSIKAYDQDDIGKSATTILEIPFEVNRLPPVFSSENTAYISNPEFQGRVEIGTVQAHDGDIDINAEIQYANFFQIYSLFFRSYSIVTHFNEG